MKLCIVNENFKTETVDGLSNYYRLLVNELYAKEIDITVITNGDNDCEMIENGIRIITIKKDEEFQDKIAEKLKELQKNGEIDIIEASNYNALTIHFEKDRKVPLIIKAYKPYTSSDKQINRWEKKLLNNADLVTVSTNCLKNKLELDNIKVIPKIINNKFYNKNEKKEKNKTILFCGKLTEENGVFKLANIIPDLIDELGNIKFLFIGEDSIYNEMSSSSYIKSILPKKYLKNIEFISNINNEELNDIYNDASILVTPRVNDDISYVYLECMKAGLPFVSFKDNAINEILLNKEYLTDEENLKERIINLYLNKELSKLIIKQNMEIIENKFNNETNISNIIKLYKKVIELYDEKIIKELFKENLKTEINTLKKIEGELTNSVYLIESDNKKYVIKIYKKHINENTINSFMDICNKNNINIIKPIENKFMKVLNSTICIYEYVEGKHTKKLSNDQIEKLIKFIKIDKISNIKNENMMEKVNFYYESLRNMETKKIRREVIDELLKKYMKLQNYNIFDEKQLVHGDMSPSNLIWSENGEFTLLDLDEVIEFTKLYDLVVFALNASRNKCEIDIKLANKILKPFDNYTKIDIINVWNFYLLKVILEKIYLYEIGKIDLREQTGSKDDFEDWLYILNSNIIEDILNK